MATAAQISANRENALHSTGPRTEAGKAASCKNNFRFGFVGKFSVLDTESQDDFDELCGALFAEHAPETATEKILVEKMAQHIWLGRRAQDLQGGVIENQANLTEVEIGRRFSLFLRYQTTNDRGFHKCLDQLAKLRAEKRKAEIGFERQKQQQALIEVRQAAEKRKQDHHKFDVMLAQAKTEHQGLINMMLGHDHHELRPLSSAAMDRSIAVATGKAA